MTIRELVKRLKPGKVIQLCSPTMQYMMTGASRVIINKNSEIVISYEDGSTALKQIDDIIAGSKELSVLQAVAFVQRKD